MQSNWRYIKLYQECIRSKIGIVTLAAILITGLAFIPALDIKKVDAQNCGFLIDRMAERIARAHNLNPDKVYDLLEERHGEKSCEQLRHILQQVMKNPKTSREGRFIVNSLAPGKSPPPGSGLDGVQGTTPAPGAQGQEGVPGVDPGVTWEPGLTLSSPPPMTPASPPPMTPPQAPPEWEPDASLDLTGEFLGSDLGDEEILDEEEETETEGEEETETEGEEETETEGEEETETEGEEETETEGEEETETEGEEETETEGEEEE
jgi:hypothetical protein